MTLPPAMMKGVADIVVLQVLDKHGESYGYELIQMIGRASKDAFAFKEGTLYPLLYRLEDQDLVESRRKPTDAGKVRRYYQISKKGKAHLADKTKAYQSFIKGLQSVLEFGV